jgi:hypothetical protein
MTEFLRGDHLKYLRSYNKRGYATLLTIELAQAVFLSYVLWIEWNIVCSSNNFIKGKTIFLLCIKLLNKANILTAHEAFCLCYNVLKCILIWIFTINITAGHQCYEDMPLCFWAGIIWVFWCYFSIIMYCCTSRDYDKLIRKKKLKKRSIELDWVGHDLKCQICWEEIERDVLCLTCQHHYHKACIETWMVEYENDYCPGCLVTAHEIV